MHDDRSLVEARARRAVLEWIRPAIYGERRPLSLEAWVVPGEPVPVAEARAATYEPFTAGSRWGRPWGTVWFRCTGEIPVEWNGHTAEVLLDLGFGAGPGFQAEGLIFPLDADGPVRGVHPLHQAVPVALVSDGGRIGFLLEAAANPIVALSHAPTPLGDLATAGDALLYRFSSADVAVRNDAVYHLDLDLQVVTGLLRTLPERDAHRYDLVRALDGCLDLLDPHDVPGSADAARKQVADVLARRSSPYAHQISAIGHAHIDSAWLWPLRETRRKCARTFSSAVTLMDQYPDYKFVCSQAAQYDWIEHDHPELFERIRAKVADGRFVPTGSMWVESDTNLPSGESLARQFAHGKRYWIDRFGIETTDLWLPDVFGYAGNLPQLIKLSGGDTFLTQKLSWNQTNAFPHHTFWWEGIDGSQVFTHFPPADTYNGDVTASELAYAADNFRDKGRAHRSVYLFGHGDGGGGPTREHLERMARMADLDGLPHLTIESPNAFFDQARADYADAPVWRGELYFEMHRGTYTSQARTKWGNRRCELTLREIELWSCLLTSPPLAQLEAWWKEVLLHQFHDIIPGSSIAWVHDDTEAAHARLLGEMEDWLAASLPAVVGGEVANAGPFPISAVVDGRWVEAPAMGVGTVSASLPVDVAPVTRDGMVLDNGLVRVTVAADGTLASVVDLVRGRECLSGPGNVLQLFPDHPNTYDAWDVEAHTLALEPMLVLDVTSLDAVTGPLESSITVGRSFGSSTITQRYVVRAGSARVDIETEVDWHENEKLLKAAFPLDVQADEARYDVQFGHVSRPLHRNTTWDAARFEVCAHHWGDVSEPDFGVALLNDCKYGYDGLGNTLRLTLLRAPNYPDPDADRGSHRFTYSLLPHGAGLADVVREGWLLNLPPRIVSGSSGALTTGSSVVSVDDPGVVVTAVKPADDGSGDLIVRAYSALGGRSVVSVEPSGAFGDPSVVDLLERPIDGVGGRRRTLRRFQIETLRFPKT